MKTKTFDASNIGSTETPLVLSLARAAKIAGVRPQLIRQAVRSGALPARRYGDRQRPGIARADLLDWVLQAPPLTPDEVEDYAEKVRSRGRRRNTSPAPD